MSESHLEDELLDKMQEFLMEPGQGFCFEARQRRVLIGDTYAQSLIDDFSIKDKFPQIAISVDMLDTGSDVPEVVNIVFFKLVRSKTKFWQMVGRGTRLCPDLFGPGQDKQFFYIFDYCQNLEYFSQNPDGSAGSNSESLSTRLFKRRLELIGTLDCRNENVGNASLSKELQEDYETEPMSESQVRSNVARYLQKQVASMNPDNFLARSHRRSVERFAKPDAWRQLNAAEIQELADEVAGLPTQMERDSEEAKRFDLLLLNLQLALLHKEPAYERLRQQVVAIAGLLEEKHTIPMVNAQMGHTFADLLTRPPRVRFASFIGFTEQRTWARR